MSTNDLMNDLAHCVHGDGMARLVAEHIETVAVNDDHEQQKRLLRDLIARFVVLERRVDGLLRNTLPGPVAEELKYVGRYAPRTFECSILFADVVGYTQVAEKLSSSALIEALDGMFSGFDDVVARGGGTKIKTIGDAYMAVFGAPEIQRDHPVRAVATGLDMLGFLEGCERSQVLGLEVRIGIHSGNVAAGVVGRDRKQFDVFGESVNVASRFESSGLPGAVNVSEATYEGAREAFVFEPRGRIQLKRMDDMDAYVVKGAR